MPRINSKPNALFWNTSRDSLSRRDVRYNTHKVEKECELYRQCYCLWLLRARGALVSDDRHCVCLISLTQGQTLGTSWHVWEVTGWQMLTAGPCVNTPIEDSVNQHSRLELRLIVKSEILHLSFSTTSAERRTNWSAGGLNGLTDNKVITGNCDRLSQTLVT